MGWSVLTMTEEDVGKLLHYQLEAKFERLFAESPRVEAAAMFRQRKAAEGVLNFYFSPGATEIFREDPEAERVFRLQDCPPPFREEVTFVTGDVNAVVLLHGKDDPAR